MESFRNQIKPLHKGLPVPGSVLAVPADEDWRHSSYACEVPCFEYLMVSSLMFVVLRLVFTSDGVVVGVVIRRVERYDTIRYGVGSRTLILLITRSVAYDQLKTALSESQAEAEE